MLMFNPGNLLRPRAPANTPLAACGIRYVLGFTLTTGQCTLHVLDSMHGEIADWMRLHAGDAWLVVRAGKAPADHRAVDHSAKVIEYGQLVGSYKDRDITEVLLCADGSTYQYTGVLSDLRQITDLAVGTCVLAPGLLYQPITQSQSVTQSQPVH